MAEEKIASRIKDPVTKQEYYIGTRGSIDRVALKLSVPDDVTVDWTTLTVTVQNESTGKGEYWIDGKPQKTLSLNVIEKTSEGERAYDIFSLKLLYILCLYI